MKKNLIILFLVLLPGYIYCQNKKAKTASEELAFKMAEEVCSAMEIYDPNKKETLLETAEALLKITEKEEEYGSLSEKDLLDAMKKICPKGRKKFLKLAEN